MGNIKIFNDPSKVEDQIYRNLHLPVIWYFFINNGFIDEFNFDQKPEKNKNH